MATTWVNGVLRPEDQPVLRASDHGLLVGDGVFETAGVVDGVVVALTRHLRRLRRSVAGLGLELDRSDDELAAAAAEVISANQPGVGRLRITVTGGPGPPGLGRGPDGPTVLIGAGRVGARPRAATVVTVPWPRNERSAVAGIKTISYAEHVVAWGYAAERGADEAIFANTAGNLCEGAGSNVFLARAGRLLTPPLSSGCLPGITRELLLEVADVAEDDLTVDDLRGADEAFLTSSTRGVHQVATVDGRDLPRCPGPLTGAAAGAYADLVARDRDP